MATHNDLGAWGEQVAVEYLRKKGYIIVECDWHSGHRDIDIIALDGDVVVFVEVKTRRDRIFIEPEQAVDYRKIRNIQTAANHYIKFRQIDKEVRFDVITVVGTMDNSPEICHIEDAF
ncbi:MAG: YraN family protein [Prevotella sp.]|nr:YraN family protein [Prevotella sp.]